MHSENDGRRTWSDDAPAAPAPPTNDAKTEAGSDDAWFYVHQGNRKGPVSTARLRELFDLRLLNVKTSVWKAGWPDWMPLGATDVMKWHATSVAPPVKGHEVNNGVVWALAFAPIWSSLVIGFCLGIVLAVGGSNEYEVALFIGQHPWVISAGYLAINVALCYMDEARLKRSGYDSDALPGAWLIPVYLYKRAKLFGHGLGYFITWMVCFCISVFLPS